MARAALLWTLRDLAERSGVSVATIVRFEDGGDTLRRTNRANVETIIRTFNEAGIRFLAEDGMVGVLLHNKAAAQSRLPKTEESTGPGLALPGHKEMTMKAHFVAVALLAVTTCFTGSAAKADSVTPTSLADLGLKQVTAKPGLIYVSKNGTVYTEAQVNTMRVNFAKAAQSQMTVPATDSEKPQAHSR